MRRNTIRAIVMIGGAAFAAPAAAADCIVADPTGTPLNVRAEPQGAILTALGNGTAVDVLDRRTLEGKRWAKIGANGKMLGWVFANYLKCAVADDSKKSAPMRPRTPPP